MALVEVAAQGSVSAIRDQILEEVRRWSSNLDDDVTLIVARYRG